MGCRYVAPPAPAANYGILRRPPKIALDGSYRILYDFVCEFIPGAFRASGESREGVEPESGKWGEKPYAIAVGSVRADPE
jgi:hypothetical protein